MSAEKDTEWDQREKDALERLLNKLNADASGPPAPMERQMNPNVELTSRRGCRYVLLELRGEGGMGSVWRARELGLGNRVRDTDLAFKIITSKVPASNRAAFIKRLDREIEYLGRLSEIPIKNIARIIDFGEDKESDVAFYVMDWVAGEDLRQVLGSRVIMVPEAVAILEKVACIVHEVHEAGFGHRDIKPGNIMVAPGGAPWLVDFGLAKRLTEQGQGTQEAQQDATAESASLLEELSADLTGPGCVPGTPYFMAPERILHPGCCSRSADVYSLGVTFYQLLTCLDAEEVGNAVSTGDAYTKFLDALILRLLPFGEDDLDLGKGPVLTASRNVLANICLKCLARNPAHRYATAADLAKDLRTLQAIWIMGAREAFSAAYGAMRDEKWDWARVYWWRVLCTSPNGIDRSPRGQLLPANTIRDDFFFSPAKLLNYIGKCSFAMGDYEQAVRELHEVLRYGRKDWDNAKAPLAYSDPKTVLRLELNIAEYHLNLGNACAKLTKFEQGITNYSAACEILVRQGRIREADRAYHKSIEMLDDCDPSGIASMGFLKPF